MNLHSRTSTFAQRLILAAALLLVPLTQEASARGEGGPGPGGGVGIQKKTHIVLKTNSLSLNNDITIAISKHWDVKHTILIPNSTPRINKAIVKFALRDPYIASVIITNIAKGNSKNSIRKNILSYISSYTQKLWNDERELELQYNIRKINETTINIHILKVLIYRAQRVLETLEE